MAKHEAKFTAELRAAFEQIGAWAYKIPDAAILPKSMGFRRTPVPRPFDLVICLDGRLIAIEVKQMQGYKAFGPRMMQPSQMAHLDDVEMAGGDSLVALFVHGKADGKAPRFRHLLVFCWPGLSDRWQGGSIKAAELRALPRLDWTRPAGRHLQTMPKLLADYRAGKPA